MKSSKGLRIRLGKEASLYSSVLQRMMGIQHKLVAFGGLCTETAIKFPILDQKLIFFFLAPSSASFTCSLVSRLLLNWDSKWGCLNLSILNNCCKISQHQMDSQSYIWAVAINRAALPLLRQVWKNLPGWNYLPVPRLFQRHRPQCFIFELMQLTRVQKMLSTDLNNNIYNNIYKHMLKPTTQVR